MRNSREEQILSRENYTSSIKGKLFWPSLLILWMHCMATAFKWLTRIWLNPNIRLPICSSPIDRVLRPVALSMIPSLATPTNWKFSMHKFNVWMSLKRVTLKEPPNLYLIFYVDTKWSISFGTKPKSKWKLLVEMRDSHMDEFDSDRCFLWQLGWQVFQSGIEKPLGPNRVKINRTIHDMISSISYS